MRNIFVYPDGSRTPFKYPDNRTLFEGMKLQAQTIDGNYHLFVINKIRVVNREVLFFLEYAEKNKATCR